MADERDTRHPDPEMVALIADAVARHIPNVGRQELVDAPPTLSGRDAAAIKRTVALAVDDELSRRRVLSDTEIRGIAKEVAHSIVESSVRPFLTEEQIEEIVVEKLKDIGLKADKQHADETRETVEGLLRGHRRRNEFGKDFVKEIVKALATLAAGGLVATVCTYLALKGGGH